MGTQTCNLMPAGPFKTNNDTRGKTQAEPDYHIRSS
jgi:hypothetical protein